MKLNLIKEDDHKKSYQLIIYQKTSVKKLHFFQIISPFSFSTPNQTYELLGIHCVKIGGKMKMLSNPLFVLWGVLSSLYSNASTVCGVYFVVKGGIIFGWEH